MRLCNRCGAILEHGDHPAGVPYRGECPSCGLGYSSQRLVAVTGSPATEPRDIDIDRSLAQMAQRDVEKRDAVAHCPFPVYGLDRSWTGRRWVGGWGESGGNIDNLELAHGDAHDPNAPLVRVDTRRITAEPQGLNVNLNTVEPVVRRSMARSLVQHLWHETNIYLDATPSTFQSEDPTGQWGAISLNVDGEFREFSSLQVGAKWVAMGKVGDALLGLEARNVETAEVRLVIIANPMDYLQDHGGPR